MVLKPESVIISKENCYSCPECGSLETSPDVSRGTIVCRDCGCVSNEMLFNLGEGKNYLEEHPEKKQIGPPSSFMVWDKGLTTNMSGHRTDAHGIKISNISDMSRLRKWDHRHKMSKDRGTYFAMIDLNKIVHCFQIQREHQETAALLYRKLHKKMHGFNGQKKINIVLASLILACRRCNYPLTIKELSLYASIEKSEIYTALRLFFKHLQITPSQDILSKFKVLVPQFVSKLSLSQKIENEAYKALKILSEKTNILSGKDPKGFVGALLYYLGKKYDQSRTQKQIASITGSNAMTIRTRTKEIKIFIQNIEKSKKEVYHKE